MCVYVLNSTRDSDDLIMSRGDVLTHIITATRWYSYQQALALVASNIHVCEKDLYSAQYICISKDSEEYSPLNSFLQLLNYLNILLRLRTICVFLTKFLAFDTQTLAQKMICTSLDTHDVEF
jgi:hypothetical protein